jgi:alkanesulfonate monooxygenase SsuD/methylene tetrahydromethanopterin reductase-like flavin-dependent oxidoreductase (luciferase family)
MESHGIDVMRRRALVREKILACKELWTKEEASFAGTYVNFEASWAWPKPVQQPHPPIVVGGSPRSLHFKHIVEYADGWLPNEGRYEIAEEWPRLQQLAEEAGRDPATLSLGIFGIKPDAAHIESMAGLGATYGAIGLPSEGPDEVLPLLDRYAELVARFHQ